MKIEVWIGLGTNQGDREQILSSAIDHLNSLSQTTLKVSSIYETLPWGGVAQGHFLNQVIGLQLTSARLFHIIRHYLKDPKYKHFFTPAPALHTLTQKSEVLELLLRYLLMIEYLHGRNRDQQTRKWDSRTLDLDLLEMTGGLSTGDSNSSYYQSASLTLPHPLLHKRQFVLTPWKEIAPKLYIPVLKSTIEDLQAQCSVDPSISLYASLSSPL